MVKFSLCPQVLNEGAFLIMSRLREGTTMREHLSPGVLVWLGRMG